MKAFTNPNALVDAVDDAKAQIIQRVIFWKNRWGQFQPPTGIVWNWTSVSFDRTAASSIPNNAHGLYTFVLCPRVASHPKNQFVLYVGKAEKTTLRERFQHYFQEMQRVKRPHICYALSKYQGHLEFCYTTVASQSDIEPGEDALLIALMPPFNKEFPASVSQIIAGLT
jgi:hypothetical protein